MRKAKILFKDQLAGILVQDDDGSFTFRYDELWFKNTSKPAISLTLPKTQQEFKSAYLFPFFYHLLPEGSNKQLICNQNRIDETDDFGILLSVAQYDTIGAVKVIKIEGNSDD